MRANQRGMTLIEVAISATILSMILLALVSAMRTFANSQSAIQAASQRAEMVREASDFLRHSLRESVLITPEAFYHDSSEIVWVAPLDRVGTAGGLVWFRLARQGDYLALDLAKASANAEPRDDAELEPVWGQLVLPQKLLRDVTDFSISTRLEATDSWSQSFDSNADTVPHSVKLEWEFAGVEWPPLVVSMDNFRADGLL